LPTGRALVDLLFGDQFRHSCRPQGLARRTRWVCFLKLFAVDLDYLPGALAMPGELQNQWFVLYFALN